MRAHPIARSTMSCGCTLCGPTQCAATSICISPHCTKTPIPCLRGSRRPWRPMSRTSTTVRTYMPIIGRTRTSRWAISTTAGFFGSGVTIRLLELAATQMGPSAFEDQVGCCRRKAKLLASRPLDFGDIHPKQRKLVACERTSGALREVDHAAPLEWLGHRSAILLPRPN